MGRRVTTIELFCTIYTGMGSTEQIQTIVLCPQHHGSPAVPGCALLGAEAALQPLQQQALPPAQVYCPHQGVSLER